MPTATWERGLMRVWLVVTIVIGLPLVMWAVAAPVVSPNTDGLAMAALFVVLLAAQQLVSYSVARLIVWIVRGFIGQPRAPAP